MRSQRTNRHGQFRFRHARHHFANVVRSKALCESALTALATWQATHRRQVASMDGLMQLFSIRAGQAHYWRATTMMMGNTSTPSPYEQPSRRRNCSAKRAPLAPPRKFMYLWVRNPSQSERPGRSDDTRRLHVQDNNPRAALAQSRQCGRDIFPERLYIEEFHRLHKVLEA